MSSRSRAPLASVLAAAAVILAAPEARPESGEGVVGEWELVWSYSETEGYQNRFREAVGIEPVFPFAWRRFTDSHGDRLAFFDADGDLVEEVFLGAGRDGAASEDGGTYLTWDARPDPEHQRIRFWVRGREEPEWEAEAGGAPVLIAPDGALFVLAVRERQLDRFHRVVEGSGGRLSVVGAGGDVRGELPIYPVFSRLTGDERRIAFLHDGQLIVLGRDGLLDWEQEVPVDNLAPRRGIEQLATGDGIIVACGTGTGERATGLYEPRRAIAVAYDDRGRKKWRHAQSVEDDELWFQLSVSVSPDGGTVVTTHAPPRTLAIQALDGASGETLWSRELRRRPGYRSVSVSRAGRVILLAECEARTHVVAWNREGEVVWEGILPLETRNAALAGDDLLVGDEWVAKLTPEEPASP